MYVCVCVRVFVGILKSLSGLLYGFTNGYLYSIWRCKRVWYFIICARWWMFVVIWCISLGLYLCLCEFLCFSVYVRSINFKIDSSVFGIVGYLPCSFSRAYFIVLNVATYLDYRVAGMAGISGCCCCWCRCRYSIAIIVGGFISPSTILYVYMRPSCSSFANRFYRFCYFVKMDLLFSSGFRDKLHFVPFINENITINRKYKTTE